MRQSQANGFVSRPSNHSVADTVSKLLDLLGAKGITVFAVIDHSGEAKKAGMTMRPTKLVVFGSPKAGTPLMLAAPSVAIDLPLKLLVWEDGDGKTWVSFNDPEYLRERHHFPPELLQNIAAAGVLAEKAAE
jgi:uncharacterized protein (DUF302 family)